MDSQCTYQNSSWRRRRTRIAIAGEENVGDIITLELTEAQVGMQGVGVCVKTTASIGSLNKLLSILFLSADPSKIDRASIYDRLGAWILQRSRPGGNPAVKRIPSCQVITQPAIVALSTLPLGYAPKIAQDIPAHVGFPWLYRRLSCPKAAVLIPNAGNRRLPPSPAQLCPRTMHPRTDSRRQSLYPRFHGV